MQEITDGKLVAGLFRHDTSRAFDPQLHTHAVIANKVLGEVGKFTALHNDAIYRGKMLAGKVLAGKIYRNELAKNLPELGYTIEWRGKVGAALQLTAQLMLCHIAALPLWRRGTLARGACRLTVAGRDVRRIAGQTRSSALA